MEKLILWIQSRRIVFTLLPWTAENLTLLLVKENTEYLELFIIVDDTKLQQGQENLISFQIFDIFYQNIIFWE